MRPCLDWQQIVVQKLVIPLFWRTKEQSALPRALHRRVLQAGECSERELVGMLRVETEEERAGEGVRQH